MKRALVLVVLVAACSTGTKTNTAPLTHECSELIGKPIVAEKFSCQEGKTFHATVSAPCRDGRRLVWNDWGWGYVGEVPHVFAADVTYHVPPDPDRLACG
jgi:hypothetical protein